MKKLTRRQYNDLSWIKKNQPVSFFGSIGPSLAATREMAELGLVRKLTELMPHPELAAGLGQYKVSRVGARLMREYRNRLRA